MILNFKYDTEKHEILKTAALYCYRTKDVNGFEINHPPKGYEVVKVSPPSKTGFYACVLKKGDEIIIAYRGTDEKNKDLKSDIQIGSKNLPEQAKEANTFAIEVMDEFRGCKIYVTGHSLGGALAQIVGSLFGLKTATFNPAGMDSVLRRGILKYNPEVIVNYHTEGDFLRKGWLFDDVGTNYIVEPIKKSKTINYNHILENMKPLNTAKIDTKAPHKTMGERLMDYNNRWNSGYETIKAQYYNLKNNHSKSSCAGTYQVSGYTREDGTKVASYPRTCGAKHAGIQKPSEKYRGMRLDQLTDSQVNEILDELI